MKVYCGEKSAHESRHKTMCRERVGRRLLFEAVFSVILSVILLPGTLHAAASLDVLRDDLLSYFKPLKGNVLSVRGGVIIADIGTGSGIRKGMRVIIVKEGVPFMHPVTNEPMGRIEITTGKAEVIEAASDGSRLALISGSAGAGDKIRLSDAKIKVFFYQDKSVDWNTGDSYYQMLKETGRFDILDTSLIAADDLKIMEEAKRRNADMALVLSSKTIGKEVSLQQRLLWVDNSSQFEAAEVTGDQKLLGESQSRESFFAPGTGAGDTLLSYDLKFRAGVIAAGDTDGDGRQRLIISNGRYLKIFMPGISLQSLYDIKLDASDDVVWLDAMDVNSDGKDEILVTSLNNYEPISYIYAFDGKEFSIIWKDKVFLRKIAGTLICQGFKRGEGFSGPVFTLLYGSEKFKKGGEIKLPHGVNIYDFAYIEDASKAKAVLAYDDAGRLNLYNGEGVRMWQGKEVYGGFMTAVKKDAPTVMVDAGAWSIKDRLYAAKNEIFVVERVPISGMASGLGYKSSNIKALWWNGVSMEERGLVEDISGGVTDYVISGDRLFVLTKPLFGIKAKNILKGESPFGSLLYIYSLKGLSVY